MHEQPQKGMVIDTDDRVGKRRVHLSPFELFENYEYCTGKLDIGHSKGVTQFNEIAVTTEDSG